MAAQPAGRLTSRLSLPLQVPLADSGRSISRGILATRPLRAALASNSAGMRCHAHPAMNQQPAQPISGQREDGLPVPRRYWSAAAIWLALSMAVLDSAIANVALPTIARELGASPSLSVWVINAYQLTITVLLLPLAALGDRIGYKC